MPLTNMVLFLALSLLLGMFGVAHAACPANEADLRTDVSAAYTAYMAFDVPSFTEMRSVVREDVGCLTEEVDANTAARVHLVEALAAVLDNDSAKMVATLRGLRSAAPDFVLSAEVAPSGSVLRTLFNAAAAYGTGSSTTVTRRGVTVLVDGRTGVASVPSERAALVQVRVKRGALRSWYVEGGELPDDLLAALTADAVAFRAPTDVALAARSEAGLASPAINGRHDSRTLLITGLATGLASGATLIAAASEKERFFSIPAEDAQAVYNGNQALGFTGYGLGVAAVGLGVTAVIVGRW